MFAVFHKGQFVDWWHNTRDDSDWVERTLSAMQWNPRDIEVYDYYAPAGIHDQKVYDFTADKKLRIHEEVDILLEPEGEGDPVPAKAWRVVDTWDPIPWWINGARAE